MCMKDFDSSQALKVNMLAEIDIGKASSSYQTEQLVFAKLLPYAIDHL